MKRFVKGFFRSGSRKSEPSWGALKAERWAMFGFLTAIVWHKYDFWEGTGVLVFCIFLISLAGAFLGSWLEEDCPYPPREGL